MSSKKALPILFAVMFLVMLGFGIIIPIMPFYAEKVATSTTVMGLLMSSYSIMQFLFAPVWGGISDRIGRKPVLMIGIAGLALSFFLFAASHTILMMFVSRILGGILSSANMPTTMAYVADITTPENRGKGMGMIGAAVGMGFIFGPAIGGAFSAHSLATPFLIAGSVAVITFLFVLFVLKESLPKELRKEKTGPRESRFKGFKGSLSWLYVLTFFVSFSMSGLEATFAYYGSLKAGLTTESLGYIFMIMGFGGALVQGGLVGRLIKKRGEGAVIQIGLVVSAVGFALILLTHSFLTAAIYLTVFGLGNGLIRPAVSALVSKKTVAGQGSASGLLSSFDSLGRILGPTVGSFLYGILADMPYISGVVLTLIAWLLYRAYVSRAKEQAMLPNDAF